MKANHGAYAVLVFEVLLLGGCTAPLPPLPPSGLVATATSSSTIHVRWQDNSNDESAFTLERSASASGHFAPLISALADATSYDDDGLPPGKTYYYRVSAVGAGGTSARAGPVSATTPNPGATYALIVQRDGTGAGVVTGTGISCGTDCTEDFDSGASVTLTATPEHGSTFAEWTGCDSLGDSSCTVAMNAARKVFATFSASAPTTFTLTVQKSGAGTGTVTAAGISCGTDCTEPFDSGARVTLTATPDAGSTFASWSGCDSPSGPSCTVTMNVAKAVAASFDLVPVAHVLTVQKSAAAGTAGSGTIVGTGVNCGDDCSEAFAPDTSVTLTAAPSAGSILLSWSGCDSSTISTCSVAMSAAKTVTATFLGPYTYSGTTLSGLKAISPGLRFGDLTIAAGLVLEPPDGASIALSTARFTLPSGGSIRFNQSDCSYLPPPDLSIIGTGAISLSGGNVTLPGKSGVKESPSTTTCSQCRGTRGGNVTLQGATIDLGSSSISLSGGRGSTHAFPDGRFYGCDGGAGGHLTLAATGALDTHRETLIAFQGGAGGGASYGLPAGTRGADGYSTMSGSSVSLAEQGASGNESNALVQNAQRLTHQRFTLAGASWGPDDSAQRGMYGTVVISGPNWSDFCEDLYVVQARSAGTMTFSLAGSTGNLDLYLVDMGITTLYAHSNGPTANEAFSYYAAAGDYVLCVSWADGQGSGVASPVGYTVTVGP